MRKMLLVVGLGVALAGCVATPKLQTTAPITKQQAIDIALKTVQGREKWGDHVDVVNVRYDDHKWLLMLSGYWLGEHGEHLSPVDAMDRYVSIDDQGNIVSYCETFSC